MPSSSLTGGASTLRDRLAYGVEIHGGTARLAAMNLVLNGTGPGVTRPISTSRLGDSSLEDLDDPPAPEIVARQLVAVVRRQTG